MLPMTTAQILLLPEPAHTSSSCRPALTAVAQVVLPVAQGRFPSRSARSARASVARVNRSGALPSSEHAMRLLAGGRARVLLPF